MSAREIRRHIGQCVIVGFDGPAITDDLRSLAREFDLGGLILFARNIVEPEQVAELSREAQELAKELPLWVSVDQEGGRVARLRSPFTAWPAMAALGRSGDVGLAERFARALAEELSAVGITLDYMPVLDVNTNPRNPVIGDRALADRADTVARLGAVIIRTLQTNGIAACGKHFPGHGDTSADSHFDLPVIEHSPERLRETELVPFRAAVEAGVASIMAGHLLVPALDETYPATLSKRILCEVLRGQLGHEGLILSDDLGMRAISDRHTTEGAAILAVAAGCDVVLMCGPDVHRHAAALESMTHAVETGGLPAKRVEDTLTRQRNGKRRFLHGLERRPRVTSRMLRATIGREEHVAIADEMARLL